MNRSHLRRSLVLSVLVHFVVLSVWRLHPPTGATRPTPVMPETPIAVRMLEVPPSLPAQEPAQPRPQVTQRPESVARLPEAPPRQSVPEAPKPPPAPRVPESTTPKLTKPPARGGTIVDLPKPVREESPDDAQLLSRYNSKAQDIGPGDGGTHKPSGEQPRAMPLDIPVPERYSVRQPPSPEAEETAAMPAPEASEPAAPAQATPAAPPQASLPPAAADTAPPKPAPPVARYEAPSPPTPPVPVPRSKPAPPPRLVPPTPPRAPVETKRRPDTPPSPPVAQAPVPPRPLAPPQPPAEESRQAAVPPSVRVPPARSTPTPPAASPPPLESRRRATLPPSEAAPAAPSSPAPRSSPAEEQRRRRLSAAEELAMMQRSPQERAGAGKGSGSGTQSLDEHFARLEKRLPLPTANTPGTFQRGPERAGEGRGDGQGGKYRSIASFGLKHASYLLGMQRKIELVFSVPAMQQDHGALGVPIVGFTVRRSGELAEAVLLRSSGYPAVDQALIKAVRRAAPYTPFPHDMPDQELSIRIYASIS